MRRSSQLLRLDCPAFHPEETDRHVPIWILQGRDSRRPPDGHQPGGNSKLHLAALLSSSKRSNTHRGASRNSAHHPPYSWNYKPLPGTADANKYNLLSLKIDAKNSIKDATSSYVPFGSVLVASFGFSQLDAIGVW